MSALAAMAGATAALGLLLVVAGVRGTTEPATPRAPRSRVVAAPRLRRLAAPGIAAVAVLLITGWVVAALLAAVAAVGLPRLLGGGRSAQARLARLEALADWTRRLADVLTAGTGLEQALQASQRTVPAALSAEVGRLVGTATRPPPAR